MQTKSGLHVEIKDADKGTFVALFSTLNQKDHDGDVTRPGAFEHGAKMAVSAYGHSSWAGRLPVGKASLHATDTEAQAHGQFFMDTKDGSDTFKVVKSLAEDGLGEWSYGFDVTKKAFGEWPDDGGDGPKDQVRFLEGLKVHEVSPVLLGAGIDTMTMSAKGRKLSLDEITDDDLETLLRGMSADRLKSLLPAAIIEAAAELSRKGQEPTIDDTIQREQLRYELHRFESASGR